MSSLPPTSASPLKQSFCQVPTQWSPRPPCPAISPTPAGFQPPSPALFSLVLEPEGGHPIAASSRCCLQSSRFLRRLQSTAVDLPDAWLLWGGQKRVGQTDLGVAKRGYPTAAPNLNVDRGGIAGPLVVLLCAWSHIRASRGVQSGTTVPLRFVPLGAQLTFSATVFGTQAWHVWPPDAAQFMGTKVSPSRQAGAVAGWPHGTPG